MTRLIALHDRICDTVTRAAPEILPFAARLTFAGVLLIYFWASALTKLGDGVFGLVSPSVGAYSQIFPRALEAAGYDTSQFGPLTWAVVVAGTWAEFLLPLLIVIGLATRLAALGMIGFVLIQSGTDIWGHGVTGPTLGAWFDRASDAVILDQRALWLVLLAIPLVLGAGRLSVDGWLRSRA